MNRGIGFILLNSSVAIYLFATGILGITKSGDGGEIRAAVNSLFGRGEFANILVIILAVMAIAAGVFIILKFFGTSIEIIEVLLIVLGVTWVIFIVLIDIAAPLNAQVKPPFVYWLRQIGSHVMVLSGILLSTERFGEA